MELAAGSVDGDITSPENSETESRPGLLVSLSSFTPEADDKLFYQHFPTIPRKEFQELHQIEFLHQSLTAHQHLEL